MEEEINAVDDDPIIASVGGRAGRDGFEIDRENNTSDFEELGVLLADNFDASPDRHRANFGGFGANPTKYERNFA